MSLQETVLDDDFDLYIPEFLWNFWLEACPVDLQNLAPFSAPPHVGLHVFDTYRNELSTGLSDHRAFSRESGVFDHILCAAPAVEHTPEWHAACTAFRALEKDAETAIRSLIQQVDSKPRFSHMYGAGMGTGMGMGLGSAGTHGNRTGAGSAAHGDTRARLSLGRHALQSLQRYLLFLRFRNRETYKKLLELTGGGGLFLSHRIASLPAHERVQLRSCDGHSHEPLSDWKKLLRNFTAFLSGSTENKPISFIRECIHRRYESMQDAEICIGLAAEPDEYILSASCFGVVEEDGVGNLNDTFYYFFPISPRFTIYMLIEAPFVNVREGPKPPHFLDRHAPVPPFLEHDVESSIDIYQRNALLLQTQPRFLIFVSARSLIRTLTYYAERRWLPGNLDYSKLLRGCREESVTHTLLVKAKIEVNDLTDDVGVVGEYAVSYGSFADVWRGVWAERQTGERKMVALKVLRANLVGYVQERLLKRLKKEVQAWYRLEHPHVARLHGIMQLPNTLAMVSPWCENGTVVRYLRETNPGADRVQLLYEIASGVLYLHSCDPVVVHGDLKGCNILIDAAGHAVITDFGLAKVKEEVSDAAGAQLPTSFFAGSTRWMAPELLLAQVEDDRRPPISTFSDVYAFASVCLEVLTGQLPYANRRNDHGVTLDIMNGVKPTSGLQGRGVSVSVGFGVGVGVGAGAGVDGAAADPDPDPRTEELWGLMDCCWDQIPRARPGMGTMCECLARVRMCGPGK
ncbi:hypothetical protein M0805_004743 [Coniferiporia weirii]|nr:hypothetical protein M0805_004743 [Coniferiporia weirii]